MLELNKRFKLADDQTVIGDKLIVNQLNRVFVFEEFEFGILSLFDGMCTVEQISSILLDRYKDSYNEQEFIEFVGEMVLKEVLICVDK